MITYTKTEEITRPRLEIRHDDAESPREWDNLGYFITVEDRYQSPDDNKYLRDIIENSQYADGVHNSDSHIDEIKRVYETETDDEILHIVPVYRYEHGNVLYRRGEASGFDHSNCGFYIVTKKTQAVVGTPPELFDKVIDGELDDYTKYVNGEVYYFTLYSEDGEHEDSCGGFYDIEDIREHLPEEFAKEDLADYIKY